jgi:hypothetical protein
MKSSLYVFMGIGYEYVFKPLVTLLRAQHYECLELDLLKVNFSLADWKNLAKREIVFITSSHLEAGKERCEHVCAQALNYTPSIIAPLEVLDIIRPVKSVYIPHDLTTPLGYYEWKFIDQFDLFFNPLPFLPVYLNLTETKELGWINYTPHIKTLPDNFSAKKKILFVSLFIYLQNSYGLSGLFEYFQPLLDENTAVKFSVWGNYKEAEAYFRKNSPVMVCDAHWNSVELMQHFDIIIGNHISSVLMEAALLNKKVFCLESDIATPYPNYQRSFLGYLPNLEFIPYFDPQAITSFDSVLDSKPLKPLNPEEQLKPFDFKQAIELITA